MKGMEEEELERLNHYRVQMVEKVDNLMFVLKQKRKTVKDITLAVYEFMVQENIQERLKKNRRRISRGRGTGSGKGIFSDLPDHHRVV